MAVLEIAHKISQHINLASLEVSSVASELDCEEEKISQIADYLKAKEGDRESMLTVTAIAAGAVGAAASGILLSNNKGGNTEYVGIASGITEATLGLLILLNKRKIDLNHPSNALKEIWEGPGTSKIFSPFIWHYLNFSNPENQSMRQQIVERWRNFNHIDDVKAKKQHQLIDLYFGNGGKYTTEQLYNRASM